MSGPRIGELFAGYGGLGLGVQQVYGGEVIWVSEFDKGPSKILAHRFPGVPNHGDITKIDWAEVEPVDILTGGSPCQDLSHAGRRAGMTEGTRSNLWVAMREAIAQLRPPMVVWENVGGAFSAAADSEVEPCAGCVGDGTGVHLRALGRVLGDLSSLGYDASWRALRAADVGAPHGRLRVFVVATDARNLGHERTGQAWDGRAGSADGSQCAHGMHCNAFHCVGCAEEVEAGLLPTPTARDWKNVGDPSKTAARMAERGQPLGEVVVNALLPTPAVNDMGEGKTVDRWDEWTADMQAKHGNGNGHGKSLAIEAQRLLPTPTDVTKGGGKSRSGARSGEALLNGIDRLLPTPRTKNNENRQGEQFHGENGNFYGLLHNPERWGDYAAAIARWEHVLGRPAPEPTMTSSKGNPQLSPRFVEWMMGLPDGWVTDVPGITRNEALKALGNGVVPQQAAEALRVMATWGEVAA